MHTLSPIDVDSVTSKTTNQMKKNKKYLAWTQLWRKHWSYTEWLISSAISSVIVGEIYALFLIVYPNFMLNLWLAIGISSMTLATGLTYGLIVLTGLLLGWLIYSAHLAILSLQAADKDYQPLIDLWTSFNQDQKDIINALISDESFLKLSKFLSEQSLPEPILSFLQKSQNFGEIKKLMELLKKIWSIEHMGDKLKTLTLNILSEFITEGDAAEKIEKISNLCQLLVQTNQFNHEMVAKTLEKRSEFNPYLTQLQTLTSQQDLLHKLIEEPKLMPFYVAAQASFANEAQRIAQNTESLYFYIRYELANPQALAHFNSLNIATPRPLNVKPSIYNWLKQDYFSQPQVFIQLWDRFTRHPFSEWLQPIFEFMTAHDRYRPLLSNHEACTQLINVFNRSSLLQDPNYPALANAFNQIMQQNKLPLLCDVLLKLHASSRLTSANIELLINKRSVDTVYQIINSRMEINPDDLVYAIEHSRLRPMPIVIQPPRPAPRRSKFSKFFGCLSTEQEQPPLSSPTVRR